MAGIFKSYDIRGLVPDNLNTGMAYRVGRAAAKLLGADDGGKIVVGRDMRAESPDIAHALMSGINSVGADADFLGLCDTPMTYFAVGKYDYAGALMVTASHNPAGWDGIKITARGAYPVSYDTGIGTIEDMVNADEPRLVKDITRGRITNVDMMSDYVKHLHSFIGDVKIKKQKIVIDCGNGVMGPQVKRILEGLPIDVVELYFEPDGSFPNHEANPLKLENVRDCQAAVKKEKADFGICFDGDGDRLALVDNTGAIVPCDQIAALFAVEFLKQYPGAHIIYDLRSSKAVGEVIEENGGTWDLCRVGHSHIKKTMRETGAVFAGELSGHYYFKDNFYSDSGAVALMFILRLLSSTDAKLAEVRKIADRYHHTGEINFHVDDTAAVLENLEKHFGPKAKEIKRLDGLLFDFGSWWFNVRPSNTEPVIRLNLESLVSNEERDARKKEVMVIIEKE